MSNQQKYYERIATNDVVYDQVLFDLEDMATNAANPKQRVLAQQTLYSLQAVRQVAAEMNKLSSGN